MSAVIIVDTFDKDNPPVVIHEEGDEPEPEPTDEEMAQARAAAAEAKRELGIEG